MLTRPAFLSLFLLTADFTGTDNVLINSVKLLLQYEICPITQINNIVEQRRIEGKTSVILALHPVTICHFVFAG